MEFKDYYRILEINTDASPREIRKAYCRQAVRHHPDKTGGDRESIRKFIDAGEAYEVLNNEDKREKYDRIREAENRKESKRNRKHAESFYGEVDADFINEADAIFRSSDHLFSSFFKEFFMDGPLKGQRPNDDHPDHIHYDDLIK